MICKGSSETGQQEPTSGPPAEYRYVRHESVRWYQTGEASDKGGQRLIKFEREMVMHFHIS